jgi:hypothetical protein
LEGDPRRAHQVSVSIEGRDGCHDDYLNKQ